MITLRRKQKTQETQNSDKVILGENCSFGVSEAYKITRTNVMFALAGETGCKKIALTSTAPAEGKTTCSINLAITFAQTGAKVLVIDADLRRPRVHQYMGVKNTAGLADVLANFITLDEVVRYNEKMNISYISAGNLPPNPAELLQTPKMAEILEELSEIYDFILLDTPPVSLVADALIISKLVAGMLVVVRQGQTPHDLLKKTVSSLRFTDAKILGFLLNGVNAEKGNYKGKYYHRYGYGYYEENQKEQQ